MLSCTNSSYGFLGQASHERLRSRTCKIALFFTASASFCGEIIGTIIIWLVVTALLHHYNYIHLGYVALTSWPKDIDFPVRILYLSKQMWLQLLQTWTPRRAFGGSCPTPPGPQRDLDCLFSPWACRLLGTSCTQIFPRISNLSSMYNRTNIE